MKNPSHFDASPFVSVVKGDPTWVVLDTYHGLFHGFNKTSTVIWTTLIVEKKSVQDVAITLVNRYHIPLERAANDLEAFTREMWHKGLIYPAEEGPPLLAPTPIAHIDPALPFPMLEAYGTLQRIQQILQQSNGFLRLTRYLVAKPTRGAISASNPLACRLRSSIKMVAHRLPYQAVCLHQCLALCWMLRRRRIQADLMIGVYTHPFSAHAWVVSRDIVQWEAGVSAYPDETFLQALTVIYSSKEEQR